MTAAHLPPPGRAVDKLAATLQAKAALAGVRVDPIEGDNGRLVWIVSKGIYSRECETLDEVRAFLARMGIEA